MRPLFVIPARGGSKGIPGKNIKLLDGKPLIHYSLEYARLFAGDEHICLTTDDEAIAACALRIGYQVPFMRPGELAGDQAGSYDVLRHALAFYEDKGRIFDTLVLLQPTSPFRLPQHFEEALATFNHELDMVVSVTESAYNPYYNLFEEGETGLLSISKGVGGYQRRQDVPPVYAYNGSIYIINTASLRRHRGFQAFNRTKKYVMDARYSIDLDVPADWAYAEFLIKQSNS